MRQFLVRPDAIDGARVRFDAAESHHLGHVLRLAPGAVLEVTDGAGRRFTVRLDRLVATEASGTVLEAGGPEGESPCAITLAQAILKGERMTWLVQKATELGVARLVPVETARVVARAPAERAGGRRARWERVAREAVKQCRRTVVPVVEPPRPWPEVVLEAGRHDVTWLLREDSGLPLAAAAREAGRPRRLLLLVGPEGGFTPAEAAMAEAAGARPVRLGPRILRAESAALAALALSQHLFGDLGSEPGAPESRP